MGLFDYIMNLFWPQRPQPVVPEPQPVNPPTPAPAAPTAPVQAIGPQADPANLRKWRLTYYYIADQNAWSGPQTVPVYGPDRQILAHVEAGFFAQMSLEGTGKMRDGRLLNVAGSNVSVNADEYQSVWDYHKKYLAKRDPGYSGLVVRDDKVVAASAYRQVPQSEIGKGYGVLRNVPMEPFRTLAADLGAHRKDDPRYKGKGGLVPALSKVFIKEFVGLVCPNGQGGTYVHDGWFIVNDTGGGIFGCHFDVFVGTRELVKQVRFPELAHIWFDGIQDRVPVNYDYGLVDA